MKSIINKLLLEKNNTLVVAVSGGIDSMVLLDNLVTLSSSYKLNLVVCHVNHQQREASKEEYEFVKQRCLDYNITFVGHVLPLHQKGNFHDYAHKARYEFFRQTAKTYGASKIALAHHLDDQAETILMRLSRGSSFKGYKGMEEQVLYKDVLIIRPLLQVSRKEIEHYLTEKNLPYKEDSSNTSSDYTRNRFRHQILPLFEQENPNFKEKINQFRTYIEESVLLISSLADDFMTNHVSNKEGSYFLKKSAMIKEPISIQREVLKRIIDDVSLDTTELSFRTTNQLLTLLQLPKPHCEFFITKTLKMTISYDDVRIGSLEKSTFHFQTIISEFGRTLLPNGSTVIISPEKRIYDGFSIELWYNNLDCVFPITVRSRENGDKIKLDFGTKKIKDLLMDMKVPKTKRDDLVIILNRNQEILWIPSIKISPLTMQGEKKLYLYYQRGN